MTFNPELFKGGFPSDTFIYFRTNSVEYIVNVGITNDLNKRNKEYSKRYQIATEYDTVSNITFIRYIADNIHKERMKEICKSLGGVNIDANHNGIPNEEWFQFKTWSSFRQVCDSLSTYINECK